MPNRYWWAAGAVLAGWLAWHTSRDAEPMTRAAASAAPAPARAIFAPVEGAAAALPAGRAARLRQLTGHLEQVEQTYCDYQAGTRYPHDSRPASQHADQMAPNAPVTDTQAMRTGGGNSDAAVQLHTSQSRVFMAPGESAVFSLRAQDADGRVLPLVVTRALAQGMTYHGARAAPQVALAFADDGQGADAAAGDGAYAGVLAPAQTGLAGFAGTIRTEVRYSVNGRNGFALFDVIYTPEPPAVWLGAPREVIEDGSLVYLLRAQVRQAGRYVVTGRVDDARGQPFALASFNDVLAAGPNDVRLRVFGKLLRDAAPAQPLTLRDVDGYLLRQDADPDRALMPRLEGPVLTGKAHAPSRFSDAEWQGEERTRYLNEFARDAIAARSALANFDPLATLAPTPCPIAAPQAVK